MRTCARCEAELLDGRRKICVECSVTHRWCNRCQTVKPLEEFFNSRSGPAGKSRYCRSCHYAQQRRPERVAANREYWYRRHLRRKLGIDDAEAQRLAAIELCEVCGKPPNGDRLHVDHDHQTGRIRGVLCRRCNYAVGVLEGDAEWIVALHAYIARHS